MLWLSNYQFDIARLRSGAAIEHNDVVADLIGRRQVMGDVDEGDAELLVELAQVIQDGGPEGGIDHRDRFVGDDQLGAQKERSCHHDTLALPSAQLVRVAPQGLLRAQSYGLQGPLDQRPALVLRARQAELGDGGRQDVIHLVEGVIHFKGILEDGLHISPERAPFCA